MALHLVKLCVGVDSVADLERWVKTRQQPSHVTRQTPRRAAEILEGGSLYWVIRGVIQCRQRVLEVKPARKQGQPACRIVLAPEIVLTRPAPRRAFQGWRYLDAKDAPADIAPGKDGALPPDLQRKLIELGAW